MRDSNGGQSGHDGQEEPRYERGRHWRSVPLEILREWVQERAEATSYRHLAKLVEDKVKLSPETVRKLAKGIGTPEEKTRKAFALLYLEHHPLGYVAEKRTPYGKPVPFPHLKEVLPEGYPAARADVEKLVELAKRFPNEAPASVDRLREWLENLLAAEYHGEDLDRQLAAERKPPPRKRRRKKETEE